MKSIEKSLLPTEILAEIRGELKKSISESQANEMLVWYESDLGKKITLAEEKSTSAEAYKKTPLLPCGTLPVNSCNTRDVLGCFRLPFKACRPQLQQMSPHRIIPVQGRSCASRTTQG